MRHLPKGTRVNPYGLFLGFQKLYRFLFSFILKKIPITLFLAGNCYSLPTKAYLYEMSTWENETTGNMLFIGSDGHNLGTLEENLAQLKQVESEIFDFFDSKGIPLTVLTEHSMYYFLDNYRKEMGSKELETFFPETKADPTQKQSTWIGSDVIRTTCFFLSLRAIAASRRRDSRFFTITPQS